MTYSRLNEEAVIRELFERHGIRHKNYVDIGAGNGTTWSNTYALLKSGWTGMAIEPDMAKVQELRKNYEGLACIIIDQAATPDNISRLTSVVPKDFDFLSLDIDGYDHWVLYALMESEFRPSVICLEINPTVPPPFKFSLGYNPNYKWGVNDFFGQSLSAAYGLLEKNGYVLYALCADNAIFTRFKEEPKDAWDEYDLGFLKADCGAPHFDYMKGRAREIRKVYGSYGEKAGIEAVWKLWPNRQREFSVWI